MRQNIRQGIINLQLVEQCIKPQIVQHMQFKKNITQLKYLLSLKNTNYQRDTRFDARIAVRATHDLKNKGVNIQKLEKQAQYQKKQREKQKELKRDAQQCYFYVKDLSMNNFDEFIIKNFEYSTCNNIQYSMGYNQIGKQIKQKLFQKLKTKRSTTIKKQASYSINTIANATKNQKNRKKYNNIIKQIVQSKGNHLPYQLMKQIAAFDKSSVMNLISRQFVDINIAEQSDESAKKKIIKNSVKIIEDDFSRKISSGIQLFLKTQYLNRQQFKKMYIHTDSKNRPIWGIIYLLFRAGRTQQIRKYAHDPQCDSFFIDYAIYLQSQEKFKNRFMSPNQDISDLFLQQLYAILNNRQQIRNQIIFNDRELVWIALKTLDIQNISNYNQMTLKDLQNHVTVNFSKNSSAENLENLIFTLNYDYIIRQNNGSVELDDRIHLAIILRMYKLQQILNPQFNNFYITMIKNYSQQMLQYGFQNALYYCLMVNRKTEKGFQQTALQSIEQLLINHNKVEEYFGNYPKQSSKYHKIVQTFLGQIPKQQFIKFVTRLATSYQKRYSKYTYAALLYSQLLDDITKSVECLIDLQISSILEILKCDTNQKIQARRLTDKFLKEKKLQDNYKNTLSFLEYFMQISDLLKNKNTKKLCERILYNKYTPEKGALVSNQIQQILYLLNAHKGLKIYLYYLKAIIRAYQIYFSFKEDKINYLKFLTNFQLFFKNLKNNSIITGNGENIKSLIIQIGSILDQKVLFHVNV